MREEEKLKSHLKAGEVERTQYEVGIRCVKMEELKSCLKALLKAREVEGNQQEVGTSLEKVEQ